MADATIDSPVAALPFDLKLQTLQLHGDGFVSV
jgi:hypothetical protein